MDAAIVHGTDDLVNDIAIRVGAELFGRSRNIAVGTTDANVGKAAGDSRLER